MADAKKPAAPPGTVPVRAPDGTPGTVAQKDVRDVVAANGHVMSPDEVKAVKHQIAIDQRFNDPINNPGGYIEGLIAPQLAAAARGLSVGLSDEALLSGAELLGGRGLREDLRHRLNEYEEYAPIRSAGAEMGAIAGASLLGDEAALGNAPAAIGRLGTAAERLVVGGLGEGQLARYAGAAARFGLEGGIYGAGSAASQAALRDEQLTGEALVIGAGKGALVGGAMGVGFHGLAEGAGKVASYFRKPTAGAYQNIAERTFGEAAEGVGDALAADATKAPKGVVDLAGEKYIAARPGSSAAEQAQLGEIWAKREAAFGDHAAKLEKATRDVSQAIDTVLEAGRKVDVASFGESKVNQMAKLVDPALAADQRVALQDFWYRAAQVIEDLKVDPTHGGTTKGALRKAEAYLEKFASFEKLDPKAANASVEMFTAADDFKRFLSKEADFGKGPFGLSPAARSFDELFHDLRNVLEIEHIWGKAAIAQREVNGATHSMLGEGGRFRKKFTTEFGNDAGRPLYAADTAAISGYMNRLTSAANDLDLRSMNAMISARRQFLDAVSKNYEFGSGIQKAIATEREALAKLEATVKNTSADISLVNQVKALKDAERGGLGGALGGLTGIHTKPVTQLERLASLEATVEGILGQSKSGVRSFIGVPQQPGLTPKVNGGGFFSSLFDSVGKVETSGIKSGVVASGVKMTNEFEKRRQQITTLATNPAALTERVGNAFGPIGQDAPETMAASIATAQRGVLFLQSKLPPTYHDPFSLTPHLDTRSWASDSEIASFMRYYEAVDHPLMILGEAKKGTLTPEHVEAVKTVYPKVYDHVQKEVWTSLAESKRKPSYETLTTLGTLLELLTHETLAPDFMQAIASTYANSQGAGAETPPPPNSGVQLSPKLAEAHQTNEERLLARH